jgi:hypothetical protein
VADEFDRYPDHPLKGVDPAVLQIARGVLSDAAAWKDVDVEMAEPIADSVVSALRQAGWLRETPKPSASD